MGDLTIRGVNDELRRKLELRAASNGRTLDEEIRAALERVIDGDGTIAPGTCENPAAGTHAQRQARIRRILAIGRPPDESFDLKAFSDALSDGRE